MRREERRCRLGADAARTRDAVRRVATQGDEVGHLLRFDAVPFEHLAAADARDLADALDGLEDRYVVCYELERVPVGSRDERRAAGCALGAFPQAIPAASSRPGARSSCSSNAGSKTRPAW